MRNLIQSFVRWNPQTEIPVGTSALEVEITPGSFSLLPLVTWDTYKSAYWHDLSLTILFVTISYRTRIKDYEDCANSGHAPEAQ